MGETSVWEFLEKTTVLGTSLAEVLGKVVLVVVVTLVARLVEQAVVRVCRRALGKAKVPSASIIVNILRGVVWMLALMTVLEPVFGVQPTAFVAALGVGSVALSLGMQDTVSNIIGGLSLMLSKVIKPGDVIKFGDFTGTVTDINWRCTCVADAYGQVNLIPNSVISKTAVVKLSPATKNCCVLPCAVAHGTDLDAAREEAIVVAREVLGDWVDPEREVWITVIGMDAGGFNCQLSVPLMGGVFADHARTRLAGALSGCAWVRKP